MVLDARLGNAYEDPENPWVRSLAAVEQLRYVFLEDFEVIRVHSEDIRDCYRCFSVGPERSRRNALKLRLRPHECRGLKAMRPELEAEPWLVPALKTVAMGDTAVVGMAQCAHLGVLLSTGRVSLDSFLSLEGRPPHRGPICGLMIDDFVCLDRVSKLCPRPIGPSILEDVRTAYSLNLELQRSLGTYLSAGLRPGFGYLQSALNPADDRTRETELRSASRMPSAWFEKFLEGDLEALQKFLHSVGLSDSQIRGLPDPAEITQSPAFVGVSSSGLVRPCHRACGPRADQGTEQQDG